MACEAWRHGLLNAIDAFNTTIGADPLERIGAWGAVQSALSDATGQEITTDNYLRSLTIFQAGSFALEIAETPTGPDFLPVLMARSKLQPDRDETTVPDGSDHDEDHGDARDEAADALLPPQLQNEFSRRRFVSDNGVASAYVLERNTFVVLEPSLKEALRVVHQKRLAPEAERREFLRNPRTFIASVLGEDGGGSGMFVETQQYSERVLGLGLWKPPALPWLARFKTTWLPEGLKVSIDGQEVTITEPLESLARRIETAKLSGEPLIDINGQPIQIEALEAVLSAQTVEGHAADAPPDEKDQEEVERGRQDRNVLLIADNLEEPSFVATLRPRRTALGDDLGLGRWVLLISTRK